VCACNGVFKSGRNREPPPIGIKICSASRLFQYRTRFAINYDWVDTLYNLYPSPLLKISGCANAYLQARKGRIVPHALSEAIAFRSTSGETARTKMRLVIGNG